MHKKIHKKSLQYSLIENRIRVNSITRKLMLSTLLIAALALVFSFIYMNIWYAILLLIITVFALYQCYKIIVLWNTRKSIKQKIKTL